ncbi:MAG: hypothetical protein HY428_03090 [Candidatus Levybacteria bacterium]|nr:hypothetical protein [Candidatus Levybacteria bacterium]
MAATERPQPPDRILEADVILTGLRDIEQKSVTGRQTAFARSIRRNTLEPRAAQLHAFGAFPVRDVSTVVDGERKIVPTPLLRLITSPRPNVYEYSLTPDGRIVGYTFTDEGGDGSHLYHDEATSYEVPPEEIPAFIFPALRTMEVAVKREQRKVHIQQDREAGVFRERARAWVDHKRPLLQATMALVVASGRFDELIESVMPGMEVIRPEDYGDERGEYLDNRGVAGFKLELTGEDGSNVQISIERDYDLPEDPNAKYLFSVAYSSDPELRRHTLVSITDTGLILLVSDGKKDYRCFIEDKNGKIKANPKAVFRAENAAAELAILLRTPTFLEAARQGVLRQSTEE